MFTEVVRCGPIGRIALESFATHHPGQTVHVFGLESDRPAVAHLDAVIFHELPGSPSWRSRCSRHWWRRWRIARDFDRGHRGTAGLWAHLIQARTERWMVHFDSDVIFRAPALDDVLGPLEHGFSVVGPVRNYRHNPHGDNSKRGHPDVTATSFFGFDRTAIRSRGFRTLRQMCEGRYNPLGFAVIDFFDPVTFGILSDGGRISFLAPDDYGGPDRLGSRKNRFPDINAIIDFGEKFAHFSAVGSGMNFYRNRDRITGVAPTYVAYALERYAVYATLFLNGEPEMAYDANAFSPLLSVTDWY